MARTKQNLIEQGKAGKRPTKALKSTGSRAPLRDAATKAAKKPMRQLDKSLGLQRPFKHTKKFLMLRRFRKTSIKGVSKPVFNYCSRVRQCGSALHLVYQNKEVRDTLRITRGAIEAAHACVNQDLRKIFTDAKSVLDIQDKSTLNAKLFLNRVDAFAIHRDLTIPREIADLMDEK